MKKNDPTTKALQDIAAQLRRIADCMEKHPENIEIAKQIANVSNTRENSPGDNNVFGDIVKLTQNGGENNQMAWRDINDSRQINRDISNNISGDGGIQVGNVERVSDSFNTNSNEAIKNLTTTLKSKENI